MRGLTYWLIEGLLREIACKSCLSQSYIGVDRFTNQWTSETNRS